MIRASQAHVILRSNLIQYKRNVNLCIIHMHFIVKNSKLIQRPPRCKVQRACYKHHIIFHYCQKIIFESITKSGNSWHESSIAREAIEYKKLHWKGKALLLAGMPAWLIVTLSSCFLIALISTLILCTFTQRIDVRGKSSHYRIPLTSLHRSKALC